MCSCIHYIACMVHPYPPCIVHVKELQEGLEYNGMLDLYIPTELGLSTRLAHACTEAHWQRLGGHL